MSTVSVDHASEGKKYLEKGLESVKNGDIDNAIEVFFHAAVEFEKAQNFRQISALWVAVGKLLEQRDNIQPISENWPLDYHIIESDEWGKQRDLLHKLAWVYYWAAEHRERAGDLYRAYPLFLESAKKTEQTTEGKNHPRWPADVYYRVILNYIRAYGTVDNKEIREAIKKMETHYLKIKEQTKAYRLLAISYRLLKSNLIEAGNLAEAEQFKRKERSALMRYYFHRRNYFRAITEWLSGSGFMYFIIGLFLMILFVFPYIYYQWNLVATVQGKITYSDTILYSIESALGIGHNEIYPSGFGRLLNIIEAALSWLGLGVFIWWLTKRLE